MTVLLRRVWIGVHRHPVRAATESGIAFAALWSLLEPVQAFLQLNLGGWPRLLGLGFLAVAIGLWRAMPADRRTVRISGSNTQLTICYSDLFAETGVIGVPVNEFFDSALGPHVAPATVHGQLITRLFGGNVQEFERAIDTALAGALSEPVERKAGRTRRYAIGTVAYIPVGIPNVLAFALARTDLETLKASADPVQMWIALQGLWRSARIHCGERPLSTPLVGGGPSGVGLAPQHLLSLIVISAATETRRQRICGEIRICLPEALREETDIGAALLHLS